MANIKQLSARPDDLAPGHRLCGGCGASMAVRQVLMGRNDYDVVCCSATGCLEVSTSIYPDNAWNVPFIHNAFANAGATISGVEAAYKGLQRAGKIPADKKIKFVAFGGDGGEGGGGGREDDQRGQGDVVGVLGGDRAPGGGLPADLEELGGNESGPGDDDGRGDLVDGF